MKKTKLIALILSIISMVGYIASLILMFAMKSTGVLPSVLICSAGILNFFALIIMFVKIDNNAEKINENREIATEKTEVEIFDETQSLQNVESENASAEIDDLYLKALRLVIYMNNVSKTLLQGKLNISYVKSSQILDWMEEKGYICYLLDKRVLRITKDDYVELYGEFKEDFFN